LAKTTNTALLRERIKGNYADYRRIMLELCSDCVFEFAAEIAAAREVYSHAMTYDWTGEEIAAFLLKFDNPLKIIVDEWRGYSLTYNEGFEDFAFEFKRDFLKTGEQPCSEADDMDDIEDELFDEAPCDAGNRSAYFSELLAYCEKQLNIKIYSVTYSENGEGADYCVTR